MLDVPKRAMDFEIDGKPVLSVLKKGHYHEKNANDEDTEWFVSVKWHQTLPLKNAVYENGLFGNQNTVCKPTAPKWRHTVERLKTFFPKWNIKIPLNT